MKTELINVPFNKPHLAGSEMRYVLDAHARGHLSGNGWYTRYCESMLQDYLHVSRAMVVHSCTAALEICALLLEVGPGDEVIMPSYTFVSTANAFVLRGATPVFVDVRWDTLNIDEKLIERNITEKTRAIVVVHYAGVACDMDYIGKLGEKYQIPVIEDAAQSIGVRYGGKWLGGLGALGALSFHETKNIISGEGGALLINSEKYIDRAEVIREKGTDRSRFVNGLVDKYTWQDVGSSYLPSELISAFLAAQLDQIDQIGRVRKSLWDIYRQRLLDKGGLEWFTVPEPELLGDHNAHIFYILMRRPQDRDRLLAYLRMHGVGAVFHYVPLHSSPAGVKFGRVSDALPITDLVASSIIRLPLFVGLTEIEIEYVTDRILEGCRAFDMT